MFSVPSSVLVSRIWRKVSCLSCDLSLVKVMFFMVLFIVCKICSVLSFLTMVKMSFTYLVVDISVVCIVGDVVYFEVLHDSFIEEGGKWRSH